MEMNFNRFRDRIAKAKTLNLEDALYLTQIVKNVIERLENNLNFTPDNDDYMALTYIILLVTDLLACATNLETALRQRTDIDRL